MALHTVEDLRAAAVHASKDSAMLQKQVELLAAERKEAGRQVEADRQRYAKHLAFLRAQLSSVEQQVEQAVH